MPINVQMQQMLKDTTICQNIPASFLRAMCKETLSGDAAQRIGKEMRDQRMDKSTLSGDAERFMGLRAGPQPSISQVMSLINRSMP